MEELAAGEILFHGALLKKVDSRKLKVQNAGPVKNLLEIAALGARSSFSRRTEKRPLAAALQIT
jgi:hypothetical protein